MRLVEKEQLTKYTVEFNQEEVDVLVAVLEKTVKQPTDLPNICLEAVYTALKAHADDSWDLYVVAQNDQIEVFEAS